MKADQAGLEPGRAVALELDVEASEPAIAAAVDDAWSTFSGLDILVNNAGYRGEKANVDVISMEEWDKTFRVNARGPFLITKAICNKVKTAGTTGFSVINISSIGGGRGVLNGSAAYSSSKAALQRLTEVIAVEMGPYGIRCNAIAPGLFESEITADLMRQPWIHRNAEALVPTRRWGSTEPHLTSLCIFLASDSSQHINGLTIQVDGGQTLVRARMSSTL